LGLRAPPGRRLLWLRHQMAFYRGIGEGIGVQDQRRRDARVYRSRLQRVAVLSTIPSMGPRVVLDTNVVVSAFRSRQGASYALLEQVGSGRFTTCLSVPLMLEYESVLLRHLRDTGLTRGDVEDVLDFLGLAGEPCAVYFRWRPYLKDADDDMVLELAVAAGCSRIVTHNVRHFRDLPHFSVEAVTPSRFLREIGDLPWVR